MTITMRDTTNKEQSFLSTLCKKYNLERKKWLAFDFVGVLAKADSKGNLTPINEMISLVKETLETGVYDVRILTDAADNDQDSAHIKAFLEEQGLDKLKLTNQIDRDMVFYFSTMAIRVKLNKGEICEDCLNYLRDVDNDIKGTLDNFSSNHHNDGRFF